MDWPVGLHVLGGPDAGSLPDQIDALLQEAAGQAAARRVSSYLPREIDRAVRRLRRLLLQDEEERFALG